MLRIVLILFSEERLLGEIRHTFSPENQPRTYARTYPVNYLTHAIPARLSFSNPETSRSASPMWFLYFSANVDVQRWQLIKTRTFLLIFLRICSSSTANSSNKNRRSWVCYLHLWREVFAEINGTAFPQIFIGLGRGIYTRRFSLKIAPHCKLVHLIRNTTSIAQSKALYMGLQNYITQNFILQIIIFLNFEIMRHNWYSEMCSSSSIINFEKYATLKR